MGQLRGALLLLLIAQALGTPSFFSYSSFYARRRFYSPTRRRFYAPTRRRYVAPTTTTTTTTTTTKETEISGDIKMDWDKFMNMGFDVSVNAANISLERYPQQITLAEAQFDARIECNVAKEQLKLTTKFNKLSITGQKDSYGQSPVEKLTGLVHSEIVIDGTAGTIAIRGIEQSQVEMLKFQSSFCFAVQIPPTRLARLPKGPALINMINKTNKLIEFQNFLNRVPHETANGVATYSIRDSYSDKIVEWKIQSDGVPQFVEFEKEEQVGFWSRIVSPKTVWNASFSNWHQGATVRSFSCGQINNRSANLSATPYAAQSLLALDVLTEQLGLSPDLKELTGNIRHEVLSLFEEPSLRDHRRGLGTWSTFTVTLVAAFSVGALVLALMVRSTRSTPRSEPLLSNSNDGC